MALKPFNSISGISVGNEPYVTVIRANGDVTTTNLTADGAVNFTSTSNVTLGTIANVHIAGGSSGQLVRTDGNGNLTFIDPAVADSAAPMPSYIPVGEIYYVPNNFQGLFTVPIEIDGAFEVNGILAEVGTAINSLNSQVIFDDNGELTGNAGFTFNKTSTTVTANNFVVTSTANLGSPANVIITGGTNGYVLSTNGSGALSWVAQSGGGSNPGGSNTSIQFNRNGVFDGSNNLTFDSTANLLTVNGNIAASNANLGNIVTANYLVSSLGCVSIAAGAIAVIGNTAGVFNSGISDINLGLAANVVVGSNIGNVTIRGNLIADNNVTVVGTVSGALLTGQLTTAAQPNITSVGTLTALGVSDTVTASAFTANTGVFTGNGSALTALNASSILSGTLAQARLANASVTLGSTALTLGSTVTTVAGLTSVTATTFVGSLTGAATSATTAGTVTTNAQPNITSTGTLTDLSVSGQLTNGNITTGGSGTAGNLTGNWTLSAGSRLQATYADLAEKYVSDAEYTPGTVLVFGGEHEVTLSTESDSFRVAGVVTTNPAYVMNSGCEGKHVVNIALQGRAPVKVTGPVYKGDLLVASSNGHATANNIARAGTIIGKSLENFNGESGIIEVAVGRF